MVILSGTFVARAAATAPAAAGGAAAGAAAPAAAVPAIGNCCYMLRFIFTYTGDLQYIARQLNVASGSVVKSPP